MTTKIEELPTIQIETIFKAMLHVLDGEKIVYDQKYAELKEQIINYKETDVTDLLDILEPFYQMIKNNTKYMIAKKDNSFYERGHCFRCQINGDKVIMHNDMSCWAMPISIAQFEDDFIEMSKKDYDEYIELCEDGEDPEVVIKKYLD
jgi:hypothetical protein